MPIFKKKDITECDNYRGISLLCPSEKIFASVLQQRIKARTEEIMSEAQTCFRSGRSTIDQLYTLQSMTEKYLEHGTDLYVCYIDFRKAFDSMWREGLWKVMRFYGYLEKIVRLLENLYQETFSTVRVDSCLTDWFCTLIGVFQGCILSQILSNILLEMVIVRAVEGVEYLGAVISSYTVSNLRFSDDIATLVKSNNGLQTMVSNIHRAGSRMGLHINAVKTETQCFSKQKQVIRLSIGNVAGRKLYISRREADK